MIAIVLLLSGFWNWLGAMTNDYSSTGSETETDTANVVVPVFFIKKANAKMIERIYLLKVNKLQDSIIIMKDNYINEQQSIIVDFQNRVAECNKLNAAIKNDLAKQKRKNKIILGGAAGVIIGVIIGIICK